MTRGKRFFVYLAAGISVLVLGWALFIGTVYAFGGVMTVSVEEREEGFNIYLPLPVVLFDAAAMGTRFVPREEWIHIEAEIGEWAPAAYAILEALDESPDATFVEVEDHGENVRVYKSRGAIKVDVDTEDVRVKVSIPTRAVHRAVRNILDHRPIVSVRG